MTIDELQNIFFERMDKKLAGVVSLDELPMKERLEKLWNEELSDKEKKAIENGKAKTIDKYIRKIVKEK